MRTRAPWLWLLIIPIGLMSHLSGVHACIDALNAPLHAQHEHVHAHDGHAHSHNHGHSHTTPSVVDEWHHHLDDHHHHTHAHADVQLVVVVRSKIAGEFDPSASLLVETQTPLQSSVHGDALRALPSLDTLPPPLGRSPIGPTQHLRGIVMLT